MILSSNNIGVKVMKKNMDFPGEILFFEEIDYDNIDSPIREPWEIRYQDANVYDDQTLKGRKLPVENTQTAIDSAKKLLGDLARA